MQPHCPVGVAKGLEHGDLFTLPGSPFSAPSAWPGATRRAGGQAQFHQVYIDPDSIEHYRQTQAFPDGAILVKELQKARALDMTTGHVSSWEEDAGWFVMIKDTQGRFKDSGLWGDGWGWALFDPSDPSKPTTTDYKAECIGCHTPVKQTDWVHVWAYPLLGAQDRFEDFNP